MRGDRRHRRGLALAGLVAGGVSGWWYAARLVAVLENVGMSLSRYAAPPGSAADALDGPLQYVAVGGSLGMGYGYTWLLALTVVAVALAWHHRMVPRTRLVLLAAFLVCPAAQLVLLWDAWDRYPLPLVPVAAALVAAVPERLAGVGRGGRWVGRGLVVAVAALPLALVHYGPPALFPGGAFYWPQPRAAPAVERVLSRLGPGVPVVHVADGVKPLLVAGWAAGRRPPVRPVGRVEDGPRDRIYRLPDDTVVRFVVRTAWSGDSDGGGDTRPVGLVWEHLRRTYRLRPLARSGTDTPVTFELYGLEPPVRSGRLVFAPR